MSTKNNGYAFLDFIEVNEMEIDKFQPLGGSFAVITSNGKYLLCYNTLRDQWELPAGHREVDETPKECALRELFEETGQRVSYIEFIGLIKKKNISNDSIKYNPVFTATLETLRPFQENSETSAIQLWDLKESIGYVDEVDRKVLDYVRNGCMR
ncbi:NUDIX hydrolase [Sporosarcina sp. Sa2YVA2]|uniref:NUDIX hydrolase n=1 Tax=Sporosarcina quadrami TaxID=2762234 RepID=A0ABR8U8D1_9BACL|nr:NUDIX hydrolase [Sporosarcina quadrami]MBD7984294.1 NUDIX hydrolase [Sporosarcina quadrami]